MRSQEFLLFPGTKDLKKFRNQFFLGIHTKGFACKGVPLGSPDSHRLSLFICHGGWTSRLKKSPVTLAGTAAFDLVICCHPFKYVGRLPVLFPEYTGVVRMKLTFVEGQTRLKVWKSPGTFPRPGLR